MFIKTRTSYDRGGRTKAVCQKVSDGSTGTAGAYWEPVGRYSYNGIGEMVSKTLGCNIQKVDYAYNMRGWMTSLNDPNALSGTSEKDFFGMTLGYDGVGNITTWNYRAAQRTGTYGAAYAITPKDPYAYTFTYDNLNRIKTANLNKNTTSVFALGGNDAGKMGYDDNGNILSLKRTFNGLWWTTWLTRSHRELTRWPALPNLALTLRQPMTSSPRLQTTPTMQTGTF